MDAFGERRVLLELLLDLTEDPLFVLGKRHRHHHPTFSAILNAICRIRSDPRRSAGPGPIAGGPRRDQPRPGPRPTALAGPIAADRTARGRRRSPGWRRSSGRRRRGAGSPAGRRSGAARPAGRTLRPTGRAGGRPPAGRSASSGAVAATMAGAVSTAPASGGRPVIVVKPPSRTLSVNVRAATPLAPQPGGDGVGEPHELAVDVGRVVEVVGERLLVADRLDLPVGLDRALVAAAGQVEQVLAVGPAEAADHRGPGRARRGRRRCGRPAVAAARASPARRPTAAHRSGWR